MKPITPSNPLDILGLGVVAVDDFLYVDAYPPADSKVHVRRQERDCGGQTGRALLAAAKAGYTAAYGGMLGDDPLSRTVKTAFREAGVDLKYHTPRPDARPYHSTIIVDETNHTRTIFAHKGGVVGCAEDWPSEEASEEPRSEDASEETLEEAIRSATVLLIDHHAVRGTLRAVRIAFAAGTQVVADFERVGEGPFEELLGMVGHLIVPRHFAIEQAGVDNPAEAVNRLWTPLRQAVVVTCGADGGWYRHAHSKRVLRYHTPKVKTVNTTGCGDVFHGMYAGALAWGADIEDCISIAAEAAAEHAAGRSM